MYLLHSAGSGGTKLNGYLLLTPSLLGSKGWKSWKALGSFSGPALRDKGGPFSSPSGSKSSWWYCALNCGRVRLFVSSGGTQERPPRQNSRKFTPSPNRKDQSGGTDQAIFQMMPLSKTPEVRHLDEILSPEKIAEAARRGL